MEVKVISDKVQEFNGERFYLCGNYFQHKGKRLHVTVWKYHNGDVPKGCHVHHIDQNRSNNQIENLRLMAASKHLSEHNSDDARYEYNHKHIAEMQEQAKEWHASEEGSRWHSQHIKSLWDNGTFPEREYTCANCGKTFMSRIGDTKGAKYCSNACKSAARRKSGVDNEERICVVCGRKFIVNRYSTSKTCSRQCRWGLRKK